MFDIGMWELMVVGIVALIVVGPQDLPKMFRTLGMVTGRLRGMAREFQTSMNAAASEAGLDEVQKDLRKATDFSKDLRKFSNPVSAAKSAVKDAANLGLDDIEDDAERAATKKAAGRAAAAKAAADAEAAAASEAAQEDLTPADPTPAEPAPAEAPRSGTSS